MNKKPKKRIFIAVDLPGEVKKSLYEQYAQIKDTNLKLVGRDNIHITLKFIGYTDEDQLVFIKKSLLEASKKIQCFYFKISEHIASFPDSRRAKIVFLGIQKGSENFIELFKAVEEELAKNSIKKENWPYAPHVTFSRAKKPFDISNLTKKIKIESLPDIFCNKISLFESVLKRNGPEYSILNEYYLKNQK